MKNKRKEQSDVCKVDTATSLDILYFEKLML